MYNNKQQMQSVVQGTVQSFITKGKQRLKQFNFNTSYYSTSGTVYLKSGDSFEIELYNPKSTRVLARIKLDGKYLSGGGIILRPGERIFLERFLDTARKFLFDTYEVSNTQQSKAAIADNGNVEIEYFDEVVPYVPSQYWGGITWTGVPNNIFYNNTNFNSTSRGPVVGGSLTSNSSNVTFTSTSNVSNNIGDTLSYSSNQSDGQASMDLFQPDLDQSIGAESLRSGGLKKSLSRSKPAIETGRVEKGDASNQKFVTVDAQFNIYTFKIDRWKILPVSQKPFTSEDIKSYCGECGAKIKKSSFKFCPQCGNKLD